MKAKRDAIVAPPPRQPISYKDIVSGINGRDKDLDEDDLVDNSGSEMDDDLEEEESDGVGDQEAREDDPLCPVIHVTKAEIKDAKGSMATGCDCQTCWEEGWASFLER